MSVPSTASFIGVDTSTLKTITMPATSERQGRVITFKDKTGDAGVRPITLNRVNSDTFEGGATQYLINTPYGSVTFISRGTTWYIMNEYQNIVYLSTIEQGSFVSTANLANLVSTANLANLV